MRAAVILGQGCSSDSLRSFRTDESTEWRTGVPAAADQADVVLVFGGDGTIHRHLAQLVKLGLPVLIVPAGSGNDFARALGLRGVNDSLRAWRSFCAGEQKVRAIDLGTINPLTVADQSASLASQTDFAANEIASPDPRYFCSVAGVGLDAEVTRRANALPRWLRKHGGYALALAPALFRFAPLPMKVLAAEDSGWIERSDQPTMLAAFANTSSYGGGMKIAPHAKLDDGQLDICVIGGMNPFKLACMFPTVYLGRHLGIREVRYFKASGVRVETQVPLDLHADGEYVCQTPAEITIRRGALKVLAPEAVLNSLNG